MKLEFLDFDPRQALLIKDENQKNVIDRKEEINLVGEIEHPNAVESNK